MMENPPDIANFPEKFKIFSATKPNSKNVPSKSRIVIQLNFPSVNSILILVPLSMFKVVVPTPPKSSLNPSIHK